MSMRTPITYPAPGVGRRGLLAIATAPPDLSPDWQHGITFQAPSCEANSPLDWTLCTTGPRSLDPVARGGLAGYNPIGLFGSDTCSTLGGLDMAERQRLATENLTTTASHQAEAEFFDGAATGGLAEPNRYLTDGNATAVTAAATTPVEALALLDEAIARCLHGARGTIHATPRTAALWDAAGMLHLDGALLTTINDNLVVLGTGYSGNDPDGATPAAGQAWAYATGLVYQTRGAVQTLGDPGAERVDRASNTITTWVVQPAVIFTSPCCQLAAQIDLTAVYPA